MKNINDTLQGIFGSDVPVDTLEKVQRKRQELMYGRNQELIVDKQENPFYSNGNLYYSKGNDNTISEFS